MAHVQPFQPHTARRATAGLLSAVLHIGLLVLIALSGGRGDGVREDPAPAARWVRLDVPAGEPDRGSDPAPQAAPMPQSAPPERPSLPSIEPAAVPPPRLDIPVTSADEALHVDPVVKEATDVARNNAVESGTTFVMPPAQAAGLLERIERLAEELANAPQARVTWQQDGRHYEAELRVETAGNGIEPERVTAEVHTRDQGRQLQTTISLKRLPFSHFAQVIDRWDPMVQLHDDEIVGRMHINSRFNVLYDSQAAPTVLGKVTTAARGFNMDWRGRRQDADIFREGIETDAGRIPFSAFDWSPDWTKQKANARVHELTSRTRIRFLSGEGYSWHDRRADVWRHAGRPTPGQSVYFVAAPGTTVYVKGVVSGKFLVYSPERIVVDGSITYARDPRDDPDSGDYLGLVSDRDIVVASPDVTGPGDLHIQAALFAKRRIIVTDTGHPHSATLNILGSLAAGSLTESEPRYATRVEYDGRFERLRPPGFPSTNRFATEGWDRRWTEIAEPPTPPVPERDSR